MSRGNVRGRVDIVPIEPTPEAIDLLTPREQEVLGCIYIGQDGGHPSNTITSLVRKGWVEEYTGAIEGNARGSAIERLPVLVKRYTFPSIAHHMAWCEWCARQEPDDPTPLTLPAKEAPTP